MRMHVDHILFKNTSVIFGDEYVMGNMLEWNGKCVLPLCGQCLYRGRKTCSSKRLIMKGS